MRPLRPLLVIPVRGGSKGIPHKNIIPLSGEPLVSYAIRAATGARKHLHKIVVSTDSKKIASVAKKYGAEIPFIRPRHLATDAATSLSALQHAVQFIEARDKIKFTWIILLQATNPLVLSQDIINAISIAMKKKPDSVVSVVEVTKNHPVKMKKIIKGFLKPFMDSAPETIRRQDLEKKVYQRNGSIYMVRRDVLMKNNDLYGKKICPYVMPPERSIDIDVPLDLVLAEALLENRS